jgi:hypothetical protein
MSKKLKNIEVVAQILGCSWDKFSDESSSWIVFEDKDHVINISFDGDGKKFTGISIARKIYQVVDEKIIAKINRT